MAELVVATLARLKGVRARAYALTAVKFSQADSAAVLEEIDEQLAVYERELGGLLATNTGTDTSDAVKNHCRLILDRLWRMLPVMGVLHRSRSTHNAFEIYEPVRRLAQRLLGTHTRVVIASEWDYSPFAMFPRMVADHTILIGLPASEASNPLLTPLAGHELGHAIWASGEDRKTLPVLAAPIVLEEFRASLAAYPGFFPAITDPKHPETDLFAAEPINRITGLALSQLQETFCDAVGFVLFRESYAHAFSYLLAPGLSGKRPGNYPTLPSRLANLKDVATRIAAVFPSDLESRFLPDPPPILPTVAQHVEQEVADKVVARLTEVVHKSAIDLFSKTAFKDELIDTADSERIQRAMMQLYPAERPKNLTSLLDAAWKIATREELLVKLSTDRDRASEILRELLRKNAQILEYYARIA